MGLFKKSKDGSFTLYLICRKITKTWIEDFVDEDTGDVVSIERSEYKPQLYLRKLYIPRCNSKLTRRDIDNLVDIMLKLEYSDVRLYSIISRVKFDNIIKRIAGNPEYKKHYLL